MVVKLVLAVEMQSLVRIVSSNMMSRLRRERGDPCMPKYRQYRTQRGSLSQSASFG